MVATTPTTAAPAGAAAAADPHLRLHSTAGERRAASF